MREILFRGKSMNDGNFVFGHYFQIKNLSDNIVEHHITSNGWLSTRVNRETIGQFTGYEDCKGNRIFEGDILKVKTFWKVDAEEWTPGGCFGPPKKRTTYWTVEFKNFETENGFFVYGIDRRWHKNLSFSRLYNAEAEVVGNIYDNSELLKGEEK